MKYRNVNTDVDTFVKSLSQFIFQNWEPIHVKSTTCSSFFYIFLNVVLNNLSSSNTRNISELGIKASFLENQRFIEAAPI